MTSTFTFFMSTLMLNSGGNLVALSSFASTELDMSGVVLARNDDSDIVSAASEIHQKFTRESGKWKCIRVS
jgi:hypothetical protein